MTLRVWQVTPLNGGGPQITWGTSFFGSQYFSTLCDFPIGSTIRRVRVQGSWQFTVINDDPSGTDSLANTAGGQNITFGVWAGYDGVVTPSQTPPEDGSLDDRWVFWDQMTLHSLDRFATAVPEEQWTATWTFPYADNDSQSSRNNHTVDSQILLAWGFTNPQYNPMIDTPTNLSAFYNYALTWSVLMELPS